MKISIVKLTLINFKGAKALTVDFSDDTDLLGENGTFKSTVFDAFSFLLFGKDQFGRSDFSVKTWDKDGIIIPKLNHGVIGELVVDNVPIKLSRIIKEKWVTKRGDENAVFDGNETEYFVNMIPKKQGEYQEYINGIIPESTFKLLTNPYYYNSLAWEKRRNMLMSIAGTPTDEEVAGTDLVEVLDKMRNEKKTIEDLKKQYASQKKLLKEAIIQIPVRVDEAVRNKPEEVDFDKILSDIEAAQQSIAEIDKLILDESELFQKNFENSKASYAKLHEQKLELQKLQQVRKMKDNQARYDAQQGYREELGKMEMKRDEIQSLTRSLLHSQSEKEDALNILTKLRNTYDQYSKEVFQFDDAGLKCPNCKRPYEGKDPEAIREKMEKEFNDEKSKKVIDIRNRGIVAKEVYDGFVSEEEAKQVALKAAIEELEVLKSKLPNPDDYKEVQLPPSAEEEVLSTAIALADEFLKDEPKLDISNFTYRKSELQGQINQLNAILGTRVTIANTDIRIKELGEEEKSLAQQIAQLDGFEFQIEQFITRKMNEVEVRVNKLFPKSIRFRMFNLQINGGSEPACETLVNGVPWADVNHAGQIAAGIEIINVFSKAHDLYAPIWIDNAEAINIIPKSESQMIRLLVTLELSLTIKPR